MASAAEEQRRVLEAVFGESSSSDDEEEADHLLDPYSIGDEAPTWESVPEIKGLWLCRNFLSGDNQRRLLSSIHQEKWFDGSSYNQAMRFGDLPDWANELASSVRKAVCLSSVGENDHCLALPLDLLWREPLFDQLIVNVYEPGEGICAHVDLIQFEDGIAIVSLQSTCVMHFTRSKQESENGVVAEVKSNLQTVPILLIPGSLVVMSGEARYLWKHEINRKPGFQIWDEKEINQERRTSVTLRKLCLSPSSS